MSTTAFHCSKVSSSMGTGGAPIPALLNNTSSRPKASLVLAKSALTEAGSLTSVATARARDPAPPAISAVSFKGSTRRPASATA